MKIDPALKLEEALAETEAAADVTLGAAKSVAASLKKIKDAAKVGKLRDLRKAIESAERAIVALQEQFENTREGWDFDEETYLGPQGGYIAELLATAGEIGLRVYEQDERLFCPPMLLRVVPNDRCVLIDKRREYRLRPSVLAEGLRRRQANPPRFRAAVFLESLYKAYTIASRRRGGAPGPSGPVIRLLDIYNLLTLLPGQSREYPQEDFARDLYLLDRSGHTRTSRGYIVSFHASTGTKSAGRTLWTIGEDGREKVYFAIRFSPPG
ncbi:MAG: hypothetical protein ACE5JS_22690 [Nitrospinota bacterium]